MTDTNNEWKPHKRQAQFLSLPYTVREAFYGGGAGSGKTNVLLMYPIIHKFHEDSRFKQVFMRRTFPELRNEVVPRSKLMYKRFGAEFNSSSMIWTFPSGATVYLAHCENEDDVHKYDSMEISLFTPDELTSFTEYQYLYLAFTRVRSPKGLPSLIRASGMPGGIGHGWVKKRFIDPYPEGGRIILGKGGNKRIYIHATQADNVEHIDPTYAQSLNALPEAEKQAKLFGSWDAYQGQVFEEFRDKKYPDEPENALHVIEPFDIPDWWPKLVVIDWGFAAMTWVGFAAISPNRRVYIYRELHWRKTKIEEWAPYVKEFTDRESPMLVKICKSAGQERGQEHTILQQVSSALDTRIELTTNSDGSRIAGKQLLHEYLRWKPKHIPLLEQPIYSKEKAQWLLRNKGIEEYKSYLKLFEPQEDENNIPKLLIFKGCDALITAIKSCSHDRKNPEDVAAFDGDDPYDGIRYIVDAADRYFNDAENKFVAVQKRERMMKHFEATQDWNFLYRNAQILEREQIGPKAVRRYRH